MIERLEDYIFEEKDDDRTRFNFVDSEESEEIRIATMIVPDCQIDKAALEQEFEEMIKNLEVEEENLKKRMASEEYWKLCREVVDTWRHYQAVAKRYTIATSREPSPKVKEVVCEYYGGSNERVKEHEVELWAQVHGLIVELNEDLDQRGFKKIDLLWLIDNVSTRKEAKQVRCEIDSRLDKLSDPEDLVKLIEKKKNPK